MKVVVLQGNNKEIMAGMAAKSLSEGKVLVCPTDTIYGLIGDATNTKTVEKIFRIKHRRKGKPLGIFVKDIAMAKKIARVSPSQEKFLRRGWPGKVTAVLHVKGKFPKGIGTKETIGMRVPNYPFVDLLFKKFNHALAQTSVNISETPPLKRVKDMVRVFGKRRWKPDFIFDAGTLPPSRPSTVIDITKEKSVVLRR